MTTRIPDTMVATTFPEVEFAISAEGFPVALVDDIVLAMLPGMNGNRLASAWSVRRPLTEMKSEDFYAFDATLTDEAVFRARVFETAGHKRDLRRLNRRDVRSTEYTPWGPSQCATVYVADFICRRSAMQWCIRCCTQGINITKRMSVGLPWH